ncbi:MAG TPA: DUF350 domain-containing protein [Candidatus Bilamarchaeum sp.]|nr:DUF350 domain-containing protein [Candidatus Bilamarchaeum sp.]
MAELAVELVVAVARIVAALVFSAGALYSGMNLLDRLTPGVDEWKEIRKGNAALGILSAAVMVSTFLVVEPRISDLLFYIQADLPVLLTVKLVAVMGLNYLLALLSGIALIFLTISLIDRITPDLDELAELKKGNLAVAILLSAALILIITSAGAPLETIFSILKDVESTII